MRQVLFRLPIGKDGFPIFGFGAMLLLAFLICLWIGGRRAKKFGIAPELIQDLAIWLFIGGVIGGRTCFLLLDSDVENFSDFFSKFLRIWDGGLILYGAIIGGTLAYFLGYYVSFRYRPNVTTLRIAEIVAPCIALGLVFGRFGCFLNGCCYGQVACASCPSAEFPLSAAPRYELTSLGYQTAAGFLPTKNSTTVEHVIPDSPADKAGLEVGDIILEVNGQEASNAEALEMLLTSHWPRGENEMRLVVRRGSKEIDIKPFVPRSLGLLPTQLFESISMLLVMLLLFAFDGIRHREGQGLAILMFCYGVHRLVNEKLRIDTRPVGFEQVISVALVAGGIVMFIWLQLSRDQSLKR